MTRALLVVEHHLPPKTRMELAPEHSSKCGIEIKSVCVCGGGGGGYFTDSETEVTLTSTACPEQENIRGGPIWGCTGRSACSENSYLHTDFLRRGRGMEVQF